MNSIYGLLGEKLGHSLSDKIHNKIFEMLNINANYNYFEVSKSEIDAAFSGFRALNVKGINVTIPYKVDVIKYLYKISPEAEKIGAVNTIDFKDGMLYGYNTDYFGFASMLKINNIDPFEKDAYVLGNGGASKAIAQYFNDSNAKNIYIVARDIQKAEKSFEKNISNFNNKLKFITYKDFYEGNPHGILTNCTPSGMFPKINECPVNKEVLQNFNAVVDIIYNPRETLLLKYAREYKVHAVNGMYMLVCQAVKSEEIWNNIKISKDQTKCIVSLLEDAI